MQASIHLLAVYCILVFRSIQSSAIRCVLGCVNSPGGEITQPRARPYSGALYNHQVPSPISYFSVFLMSYVVADELCTQQNGRNYMDIEIWHLALTNQRCLMAMPVIDVRVTPANEM